jgi:putative transposase
MQLVEQHVIRKADSRYAAIDQAACASKDLYNAANYTVRQAFIGKNPLWKQEVNLGRRGYQNFIGIPHARFIEMVTDKAELVEMQVIVTEESYSSEASFLAADPLPIYDASRQEPAIFSGQRLKRGLYQAASGRRLNADVNGAYNILRKALPDALGKGIAGAAVHPVRLTVRMKRAA